MRSTRRAVRIAPLMLVWVLALLHTHCGWLGDVSVTPRSLNNLNDNNPLDPGGNPVNPPGDGSGKKLVVYSPQPAVASLCWPANVTTTNNGIAQAVTANLGVALALPPQVTGYSSSTCAIGSEITSTTVSAGTSSSSFWMKASSSGLYQVTASVTGNTYAAAVASIQFNENSGSGLVPVKIVMSGPSSISAGGCQAYVASFYNANNQNSSFTSDTTLSLLSSMGGTFHSAAGCTSATTSVVVPSGNSTKTVYFRSATAGLTQLTAATGGLAGQLTVLVNPGAISKLEIQGATSISVGDCRGYIAVARDAFNNASPATSALALTLSVIGNGNLFSDMACENSTSSSSILVGNASAGFYLKGSAVGTAELVAASTGISEGRLLVNLLSGGGGTPSKLAFIASQSQTNAGSCFGPVRMQIQDSAGVNLPGASAVTVALSNSGHGEFFSEGACERKISSVLSSGEFYFRDYWAENTYLEGASTGLASANHALAVKPGPRYMLVLLTNGQVFTAGSCHELLVVYSDPYGNPTATGVASQVSLSDFTLSNLAPLKFYSDSGCSSMLASTGGSNPKQMVPFAVGDHAKRVYFKENKARLGYIDAADGVVQPGELFYQLTAGVPTKMVLTKAPQNVNVGDCALFELSFLDALDNVSPIRTAFDLSNAVVSGSGRFFSDNVCGTPINQSRISVGMSSIELYYQTDTPTPSSTISEFSPVSTSLNVVRHTFAVSPGGATRLSIVGKASPLTLRGPSSAYAGTCSSVGARLEDSYGNAVNAQSAVNVALSLSSVGEGKFYADAGCSSLTSAVSIAGGTSEVPFFFKARGAGAFLLSGLGAGLGSNSYTINVSAGVAKSIELLGPTTTSVGVCTGPFEIKGKDDFGNITALPNGLSISLNGGGQGVFHGAAGCSSPITSVNIVSPAVAGQFYFKDTAVESLTLVASAGALGSASRTLGVQVGAPSRIAFTGANDVQENQCSGVVKFRVTDNFSNTIVDNTNDRTFVLTGDPSIKFYSGTCATEISEINIARAATYSSEFTFKSALPRNLNLKAESKPVSSSSLSGLWPVTVRSIPVGPTVVLQGGLAPNWTLSEGPLSTPRGSQVKVKWSSSGATSCVFDPPVITGNAVSGEQFVPVNGNLTLRLTCANSAVSNVTSSDTLVINAVGACVQKRNLDFEEFSESSTVSDLSTKYGMFLTSLAGGAPKIARIVQQGQGEPAFRAWASVLCPGLPNHNRVCVHGCGVGSRALTLASTMNTKNAELQIKFSDNVKNFGIDVLDVDGSEKWTITAYNANSVALSGVTVQRNGYGSGSGNNAATRLSINRPTADISFVRIRGSKNIKVFGFGFDNITTDLPLCQ